MAELIKEKLKEDFERKKETVSINEEIISSSTAVENTCTVNLH